MSEHSKSRDRPGDARWRSALDAWELDGVAAGRAALEAALVDFPEHAELHYDLGWACEEMGDRPRMIEHLLKVLELDAKEDRVSGLENDQDLEFIVHEAEDVLDSIPEQFQERLGEVPVVLEPRPSEGLVREEGFDPRAYGLFQGIAEPFSSDFETHAIEPTRIVLYWANLLADFHTDEQLVEQIEITILHEVGHFFGLDEDEVDALGLG